MILHSADIQELGKVKQELVKDFLNRERSKTDTNLISASKHEEILRKIETLNAVTDSNRVLREERNALTQRVKDLNERISSLEDELFPLQSQNRDLNTKIDELTSEMGSLRSYGNEEQTVSERRSCTKVTEDLESKEQLLQDSKNKEVQIRKIAKRYKDSYLELLNKTPASSGIGGDAANNTGGQDGIEIGGSNNPEASIKAELEQNRSTIESLNGVIRTMQEENEKVRKDYEDLKASVEIDERTKTLLREAKTHIVSLTESRNIVSNELASTKNKLLQNSEAHEAAVNEIKTQYEESLGRLERELLEQNNRNKEDIQRLTRENESIRPISVQNTRTAAILPTSQQSSAGGNVVAGTSTSSTSSTSTPSSTPTSAAGSSNTALVPPQQVHTTGTTALETMSSSPTSSHTDYMPSTSSASVAVAAVPPMGTASAAESSQEAESIQQPQQNEPQAHVSGGTGNLSQVVALVSPRVEGSAQSVPSVNVQLMQDPNNPQPSTSGSTSCSSHVSVSSHNRHTPSSSNVTTTQAGSSAGHKRPRDLEGDSSTTADDSDKTTAKHPKRMRAPMHCAEAAVMTVGVSDSGIDVDQVPTSSQRDQEDDVVVLDSEDDGMAEAETDECGPTDGDGEHEVYEDYDQDQDMDENECPEVNESNLHHVVGEADNNEVDVDDDLENHGQCSSAGAAGQVDNDPYAGASTSAAAAAAMAKVHSQQENNQQSQAISSGSGESPQRKQANSLTRQQRLL
ncbi:Nucleoprotein TPR [Eumeta japonica]|uniref:Nucleoprotein TPR n=1 Tax=Eumeta variegata TaxID=151549 RepID=A0A4C1SWF7_EUMVA|nr:Nucleoprotein TPR [Eumeta japonica]